MNRRGSAYLFVIAALTVVMILLLASMRKTTENAKQVFHIEKHLKSRNLRDSCVTWIFHKIKTFPFDKSADFSLETDEVKMGSGQCEFTPEYADSRRFDYQVLARYKDLEKQILIKIQGQESQRGIQWNLQVEPIL